MSDISKPHDRFFRETFSHPDVSSDFLNNYLPPEVIRHIDLQSLELIKDSFIDNELRDHFSDILCKVRLFSGDHAYVYTLLEHKSWPDALVAFQILRYMTRIWEQDFRNYEAEKKKKNKKVKKPKSELFRPILIIPVVIYHGQLKWNIAKNFSSLFDCAHELKFCIPDFSYILCDISCYKDEEIRGILMLRISLLLMKYIFREDLADRLPEVLSLFQELINQTSGVEYLKTVLTYLVRGTDKVSEEELSRALASALNSKGDELMATLAEKWIKEGEKKGEKKGLIKGEKKALLESIEAGLECKFGKDGLKLLTKIREIRDAEILSAIQKKLWTANNPDDLHGVYQNI